VLRVILRHVVDEHPMLDHLYPTQQAAVEPANGR